MPNFSSLLELEGLLAVLSAVFFLAGGVKGFLGFGLPSASIAALTPLFGLQVAVILVLFPTIATNIWQGLFGGAFMGVIAKLWPLLLTASIGTWVGAGVLAHSQSLLLTSALGMTLCVYSLVSLGSLQPPISARQERWLSPLVGAVGGLLAGITGLFVPGMIYLHWLGLRADVLAQALGVSFLVVALTLAFALQNAGTFHSELAGLSLFAVIPALLGVVFGQNLRGRLGEARFRTIFLIALLLFGIDLALRGLWG